MVIESNKFVSWVNTSISGSLLRFSFASCDEFDHKIEIIFGMYIDILSKEIFGI